MAGKKLLVADDSLTIQKVIRLALSNEGYEIQAVSDGNDAVQQISLFRPDVVLIDVSLPGRTAFEVKREMNEHEDLEEVRFVLMSSAFEKVDEEQAEEVSFHGRLTKPFDPAHLRQVLTDVLAQVTAKRMEKTSLLQKPFPDGGGAPPTPRTSEKLVFTPPPPADAPSRPSARDLLLEDTPPSLPSPRDLLLPDEMSQDELPLADPRSEDEEFFQEEISLPLPPDFTNSSNETVENWEETVQPDLPTFPNPPPQEPLGELWEPEQDPSGFIQTTPPPPLPPSGSQMIPSPPAEEELERAHNSPVESDIKELTESTMRITGMDDFQWNISEPTMRPLPPMLDRGGSNFELDLPENRPPATSFPPPNIPPSISSAAQIQPAQVQQEEFLPPSPSFSEPESLPPKAPQSPPPLRSIKSPSAPSAAPLVSSPFSQQEMETLIRNEVQAALEKMAQKVIPEVAERVIKQEILKILSE